MKHTASAHEAVRALSNIGCVLRERFGERDHVFAVVADGRAGTAMGVVAVRMVQRADAVRQLLWGCGVGGVHAVLRFGLHGIRIEPHEHPT